MEDGETIRKRRDSMTYTKNIRHGSIVMLKNYYSYKYYIVINIDDNFVLLNTENLNRYEEPCDLEELKKMNLDSLDINILDMPINNAIEKIIEENNIQYKRKVFTYEGSGIIARHKETKMLYSFFCIKNSDNHEKYDVYMIDLKDFIVTKTGYNIKNCMHFMNEQFYIYDSLNFEDLRLNFK